MDQNSRESTYTRNSCGALASLLKVQTLFFLVGCSPKVFAHLLVFANCVLRPLLPPSQGLFDFQIELAFLPNFTCVWLSLLSQLLGGVLSKRHSSLEIPRIPLPCGWHHTPAEPSLWGRSGTPRFTAIRVHEASSQPREPWLPFSRKSKGLGLESPIAAWQSFGSGSAKKFQRDWFVDSVTDLSEVPLEGTANCATFQNTAMRRRSPSSATCGASVGFVESRRSDGRDSRSSNI